MKDTIRKYLLISENGTLLDEFETKVSFNTQVITKNTNFRLSQLTAPEYWSLADTFKAKIIEVTDDSIIDDLVNAFLACPLPESVCADKCACERGYPHRSGTNLLTAAEAKQMFEYILAVTKHKL